MILSTHLFMKCHGYSRRLRSPIRRQDRYFIQSLNSFDKSNFNNIRCGGLYDKPKFSKLDSVCNDCYNLYKDPEIHSLCRSGCFSSQYFKKCVDALMLEHEEAYFKQLVETINK